MHLSQKYLTLAAAAFASAAPGNPIASIANAVECKVVSVLVKDLHLNPTATKFCSSFLSIPTLTSTTTKSTTQVIPTLSTSYVGTTTITSGSVSTSITTIPVTSYTSTTTVVIPAETTITIDPTTVSTCTANSGAPSKREEDVKLLQARTTNKVAPVPTPACLSKYKSAQISTACKCLGIPTPTSTSTVTRTLTSTSTSVTSVTSTTQTTIVTSVSTSTVLQTTNLVSTTSSTSTSTSTYTPTVTVENCPAPTACNNQGLQWAVYPNNDGANYVHGYPNFLPEHVKQATPEYSGTTSSLGGFDYAATPQGITVYNQYTVASDYFVLNHRGYIYAQQTGTYTFSVGSVDDAVCAWVGALAYAGWVRANDNLDAAIFIPYPTYSVDLVAGQYYPIRIVFGQAQGAASFEMTVTAPDGTTFLGGSTGASPYLVQFSCDGVTAPAYASFGQET